MKKVIVIFGSILSALLAIIVVILLVNGHGDKQQESASASSERVLSYDEKVKDLAVIDKVEAESNAEKWSYALLLKSDDRMAQPLYLSGEVVRCDRLTDDLERIYLRDDKNNELFYIAVDGTTDVVEDDYIEVYGYITNRHTFESSSKSESSDEEDIEMPALAADPSQIIIG